VADLRQGQPRAHTESRPNAEPRNNAQQPKPIADVAKPVPQAVAPASAEEKLIAGSETPAEHKQDGEAPRDELRSRRRGRRGGRRRRKDGPAEGAAAMPNADGGIADFDDEDDSAEAIPTARTPSPEAAPMARHAPPVAVVTPASTAAPSAAASEMRLEPEPVQRSQTPAPSLSQFLGEQRMETPPSVPVPISTSPIMPSSAAKTEKPPALPARGTSP
jgi:ribonuclease E